ncbi:FAD-dependent oxidoreductase [Pseudomonas sp. NPDC007930]|uniref:NAD(P)/FAD-dependent oxidoreductase n=1 Tax=Pseudomonas sp. NPDC007930 TaxID=3364417 RepID=UPI0036E7425F
MSAPLAANSHAASYYAASAGPLPQYPTLQGEEQADVCIIGGGFTGLNTAIELAERGLRVVLLEGRRIGWGASGRNGGQLIRGVGHELEQFEGVLGKEGVTELQRMGLEAVGIVRQRIQRYAIDCDLVWGYCDLANRAQEYDAFAGELCGLRQLGYEQDMRLVPPEELPGLIASNAYAGALFDGGSGHLHPLKLALGEANAASQLGVRLFEQSMVTRIEHGASVRVHTAAGVVAAQHLVVACNAYLGDLEPHLAGKVLPAGSYIIATEPLGAERAQALLPQNTAMCDQKLIVDYFRLSADHRLLFGGACHYSGRDPKDIAAYMRPKMLQVFPQLAGVAIGFHWAGMIGIGANRLPQIGRLGKHSNVYYAQAYAGHGLNATHLAARLVAEAIAGQAGGGFDLFAKVPHITFPGGRYLRSPLLALGMLWHRFKALG